MRNERAARIISAVIPWVILSPQAIIVASSLLGFGIFTARPDLLAKVDPEARFFTWAFYGFAVWNMAFGGLAVVVEALLANRLRALLALAIVYAVSLSSELMGTSYGIPFGAYSYTHLLGPKWFDKVPFLIPLSWFTMAWPAWVIARRQSKGWLAVFTGTALLVAWDLVLDPAMSSVTTYWIWGETGTYYGMPWSNLLGWAITGLVLLACIFKIAPQPRGSVGFALTVYMVNLSLPFGFCMLRGYWVAVLAGGASGLAAVLLVILGRGLSQAGKAEGQRHETLSKLVEQNPN